MATVEISKVLTSKSKTKETKDSKKKERVSQKTHSERLKTVVRRLPPNLPAEVFWQSVQKWVTDDTVTWTEYHQGKFRKRLNKENIPSRAYIAFKNEEALAEFSRDYDGHVFRDKAGNESIAVVEFAPFQKIPTEKKKADGRVATIEKDEDYISFLESLKEPTSKPSDMDVLEILATSSQAPPMPTTTPLLEALKAEKSAQRDKEAILRNHAHYKEIATSSKAAKKEEAKQKAAPTAAPPKALPAKPADNQPSKKAAKKAAKAAAQTQAQNTAANPPTIAKNPSQPAPTILKNQPQQSTPSRSAWSKANNLPKAPRAQRERRGSKGETSASNVPTVVPTPTPAPASSSAEAKDPAATANSSTRRSRPVIGLASRQFEAALSGAVGGRSRREREKDKEATNSAGGASEASSPKPRPAQAASGAPTILQRDQPPGILTRPATSPTKAEGGGGSPSRDEGNARGKGRGRGRGRGRGA